MLAVGLFSRRKSKKADDFFVAGRKSSSLFIVGSLLATIIGSSATLGMAGLGFKQGLTGAWWLLVGSIGLVFLGLFFARKVRKLALYTLPELVEKQYAMHSITINISIKSKKAELFVLRLCWVRGIYLILQPLHLCLQQILLLLVMHC